jgi:hypothetical protein
MVTSYAQNFEEISLWRALKRIDRGFYVEIGACDPYKDSVSLFFYEAGWRGVHVAASPHFAGKLRAARPDEETIVAKIGQSGGLIKRNQSVTTDLRSCDPLIGASYTGDGLYLTESSVPCIPLAEVLDGCEGCEIHWLKIDGEDLTAAIDSWHPSTVRPWILVVKNVKPDIHNPATAEWESTLVGLGYGLAYFDGLNRFYLNIQHPELVGTFTPGPNVFDGSELSASDGGPLVGDLDQHERHALQIRALEQKLADAERASTRAQQQHENETRVLGRELLEAGRASAEAHYQHQRQALALDQQLVEARRAIAVAHQQPETRIAELQATVRELLRAVADRQLEIVSLRASASWRITAPLRWVHSKSIARLPSLRTRFQAQALANQDLMSDSNDLKTPPSFQPTDPEIVSLSRSARVVYEQLKAIRLKTSDQ